MDSGGARRTPETESLNLSSRAGSLIGFPDRYSHPPSPRSSYHSLSPSSSAEEYVFVEIGDEGLVMDEVLSLSPESFKLSETKKQELCHSWEDFGSSNCQYAHGGKEELHPSLFTAKNRPEANTCSNKSSSSSTSTAVAAKPEQFGISSVFCASPSSSSFNYWVPQDDGIQVLASSQPEKWQSWEVTDVFIDRVLYGPTTRKRLPVFDEFCP